MTFAIPKKFMKIVVPGKNIADGHPTYNSKT